MKRLALALVLAASQTAFSAGPDLERLLQPPMRVQQRMAEAKRNRMAMEKALLQGWAPVPGPATIDVSSYDLDLHLDLERKVLSGTVEVELAAVVDDLALVSLDAAQGLRVLGVMLLGDATYPHDSARALSFSHADNRLVIALPRPLASGQTVRLLVAYGGYAHGQEGGVQWTNHGSGTPLVYTFAEPFDARTWWPCNDRPDDKAVVSLTVTAPDWMIVSSNGLEESRTTSPDGTATTRWSSRYPISTYLVVMNASDFAHSELEYEAGDGTTMPVVLYAYPEHDSTAQASFAITPEMIGALAERFGEYPFVEEKYGNCISPFGGGMEHQTLTTMTADTVGSDWVDWINVHELAHSWWGDWVTNADWRELWLNEGFASFSEWIWWEHVGPEELREELENADQMGYFVGPLYDNPVPFSNTVYTKGAWILHMLRHVVGDDAFFAGLAAYRAAYGGGGSTTEGLEAIMEQASGTELDWFFDEWVYGQNRPRYLYQWSAEAGPSVRLTVRQPQTNAPPYRMPIDVRVTTAGGTEDHVAWLEAEAEQTVDIPVTDTPTLVELDPEIHILCDISLASAPDIDLGPDYPGPFDAGIVVPGQQATLTVPVTNTGGSDLIIAAAYTWDGQRFELTAPTSFPLTLAPGVSTDFEVLFSAGGQGQQYDYLVIESNDPNRDGVALAELQGTSASFADPRIWIMPTVSFGEVPVGGARELTLALANNGAQDLTLEMVLSGEDFAFAGPVPEVLPPAQWLYLPVRMVPTAAGSRSGSITVTSNDPLSPQSTVNLVGTGIAAPHLEVSPSALLLGIVEDGARGTVTVSNSGGADLILSTVETTGPFQLADAPALPATLAPGAEVPIEVVLSSDSPGAIEGVLRILSDDPSLPWATVPLRAFLAESETERSAFAAVAHSPGIGGADWSTDAVFLNPGDAELAVDLALLPSGVRGDGEPDLGLTVPAHGQRVLSDVVAAMGLEGVGGLEVVSSAPGLVAASRTFSSEQGGTFGQHIAAVAEDQALIGGEEYVLAGLAENGGFHTNLGLLNLGSEPIGVSVALYDVDGTALGTVSVGAAGGAFSQSVSVFALFTEAEVRGGFAVISCSADDARYLAYASVVDDGSHDPTYVTPATLSGDQGLDAIVAAVASNPGLEGTFWRSQLTVVNWSDAPADLAIELHPRDGGEPTSATVQVAPRAAVHLADVVGETLGLEGSGWLRLTSPAAGLAASSRTFNDAAAGTYGQGVAAVDAATLAAAGDVLYLPGLTSADGFRSNLGIVSAAEVSTALTITVFANDGSTLGEVPVTAPAESLVQLDQLLTEELGYEGQAWAAVSSQDSAALFTVYASIVDGLSGDPAFVPGVQVVD